MTYPAINPGVRVTAALLNSMLPVMIYKPGHTDRASTITLADDPDLIAPLAANGVYYVRMFLHTAANNATRFRCQWGLPTGATCTRSAIGPDQGVILSSTSSGGQGRFGVHGATSTAVIYGNRDDPSNQVVSIEEGIVFMGTTAGNVSLQWAQATSGTATVRLAQGSFMEVRRLA